MGIGDVRAKVAGKEGSCALLGLLRKEGVKPPPPDVNVLQPYERKRAKRMMICSLSSLLSDDGSPDRCLVTLRGLHGLQPGMFVKLVLGGVGQTDPLQGVHQIAETASADAFIVTGLVPPGLENKDLTPDLFSYPSYAVRVPAPYLLPPRSTPAEARQRSSLGAADKDLPGSAADCPEEQALGLEEFKPYKKGSAAIPAPR
jgi:hypothetical protein